MSFFRLYSVNGWIFDIHINRRSQNGRRLLVDALLALGERCGNCALALADFLRALDMRSYRTPVNTST